MTLLLPSKIASAILLDPVIISRKDVGICPSQPERENATRVIAASVGAILRNVNEISSCGVGLWYKVADLNMSDPSQQCPSAWREYNNHTLGIRACRRPQSSNANCVGTVYETKQQYKKVCGRAIGYQIGSTDAFWHQVVAQSIDSYYVNGISITHGRGRPRNHIWTLASGVSEGAFTAQSVNCPCSDPTSPDNNYPQTFVGNNYYCESGNPTSTILHNDHIYSNDPLWDGQQCEGECCSNGKSPPWFSVALPNTTNDDIEVRFCFTGPSISDDVALDLLELFVQ